MCYGESGVVRHMDTTEQVTHAVFRPREKSSERVVSTAAEPAAAATTATIVAADVEEMI